MDIKEALAHIQAVENDGSIDDAYYQALRVRQAKDPDGAFLRLTPKIERAVATAALLHRGQSRKGTRRQVPYIAHPLGVAELVAKYGKDEDQIVAALLHDTIEDCEYSFEELEKSFGKAASGLVGELTEDMTLKKQADEKGSWRERKERYLAHLRTSSPAAMLVCWADKLHNLRSMISGFRELGSADFWSRFNAPPPEQAWYYREIGEAFRAKLESGPMREFEDVMREASILFET